MNMARAFISDGDLFADINNMDIKSLEEFQELFKDENFQKTLMEHIKKLQESNTSITGI